MVFLGGNMTISVIGNSARSKILASNLKLLGHDVYLFIDGKTLPENIDTDVIVLPIPSIKNGVLNIENTPKNITKHISNVNATIISYNYKLNKYNTIDLNEREDFAYLNAIPTAEGAIYKAIESSDVSLFFSNVLVTGFGRVSKILCDRLKGLGCTVTVVARKQSDIYCAQAQNYKTIQICELKEQIGNFDLIFQTVPALILTEEIMNNIKNSCIIIELSSDFVGTDLKCAEEKNIKVIKAPSLPEIIAPITAGNILTDTIVRIISEIT